MCRTESAGDAAPEGRRRANHHSRAELVLCARNANNYKHSREFVGAVYSPRRRILRWRPRLHCVTLQLRHSHATSHKMPAAGKRGAGSGSRQQPQRQQRRKVDAPDGDAAAPVALLVSLLAGNPQTGAALLAALNAADTPALRRLHPAVAAAVEDMPWDDMDTPVADVTWWRAALPAAVGARFRKLPVTEKQVRGVAAALVSVTRLNLSGCHGAATLLPHLPPSLRVLDVSRCYITERTSFGHLAALVSLDCSGTAKAVGGGAGDLPSSLRELRLDHHILPPATSFHHLTVLRLLSCVSCTLSAATLASLPPSLVELDITGAKVPAGVALADLPQLQVLRARNSAISNATVATLPACLLELDATGCKAVTGDVNFAHLTLLHTLKVAGCTITNASLASMPPSLVALDASKCSGLKHATAVLPPLPSLRVLELNGAAIGDGMVTSLPAGLVELHVQACAHVTGDASLDHVPALRLLHSIGTGLAPAVLAACRARGCTVSAAGALRGHAAEVCAMAVLGDGRLACGDWSGEVRLWDVAGVEEHADAVAPAPVLKVRDSPVCALAALPDGRRLAVATMAQLPAWGAIEVWDVVAEPPTRCATIACGSYVTALAVLADGRLAVGCETRWDPLRVVNVGARTVKKLPKGHTDTVSALAVLPDGRLASVSWDKSVRLWDVAACACVDVLTTCAGDTAAALAALPDGRLAVRADGCATLHVWDTRCRTAAPWVRHEGIRKLVPLPGGRLASCGSRDGTVRLWSLPPPPPPQ